nr:hypothetical protein [Nocardia farcinica]
MVELGEGLRLGALVAGDLHRHQPLHRPLPGQEHPRERTAAQAGHQVEIVDAGARFELVEPGRFHRAREQGAVVVVGGEQFGEHLRLRRIGGGVLGDVDRLPGLPAQVEFLVDQVRRQRPGAQLG